MNFPKPSDPQLRGPGAQPVVPHATIHSHPHPESGERVEKEPEFHQSEEAARLHARNLSQRVGHSVAIHNEAGRLDTYEGGESQKEKAERQYC